MAPPLRLLLVLLVGFLALQVTAKKDKPDVSSTEYQGSPSNLLYFEDSDVILVTNSLNGTISRSVDAGITWAPVDDVDEEATFIVQKHPYDKKVAVVVGVLKKHWITKDRGETWTSFTTPERTQFAHPGFSFHADDADRMLFMAENCEDGACILSVYYTTDGFDTDPKLLGDGLHSCMWARTTNLFTTGETDTDKDKILCVARGEFEKSTISNRVLMSSDFFETSEEPKMSDSRPVKGVTNLAAVKGYVVFAAKSERTTEMALYVSNNTNVWHRAEFGEHKLEQDAFTLLESTNYSMQVDVMNTRALDPMGVLLTSNSNGTFFTKNIEHTNRNPQGYVDFEKVANIQGILIVNTVINWEEVERSPFTDRKIQSQISFDDGRTWQPLAVKGKNGGKLHLHSVTDQRNVGRIFSSPAPGIVMGVGNTGKNLGSYAEGDLYVSDDAGLSWTLALENPHLYEFGAQGSVLVAIEDGKTKEIKWSMDHGITWKSFELEDNFQPVALTTTPDSTSLKFLMLATRGAGSSLSFYFYALDFNELHERKCSSSDFEKWPARVDEDGKPTCIMGHKQFFQRRKADKECVVESKNFEDPEMTFENCPCTEEDFECDYNFKRSDNGDCIPDGIIPAPEGQCKGDAKTFKGPTGYRLIPGNTCIRKNAVNLDEGETDRPCSESKKPIASGEISTTITKFRAEAIQEYYYLERQASSTGDDETVIMRTDTGAVYITHDQGKDWEQIAKDDKITNIYPHQYMDDIVYLITRTKKVLYSENRGKSFHEFEAPEVPNRDRLQIIGFHPKEKDWLIWTGSKNCNLWNNDCQTMAYITTHGGEEWEPLLKNVRKCQFIYREDSREDSDKTDELIFCEQYLEGEKDSLALLSSYDRFTHTTTLKHDVINFATMAEYIVVAVRDDDQQSLKVDTSIDGKSFADAKFPHNFVVPHQQAYTVLDSSTHAVFLHVTVNGREGQEYGSIIKSNSNGTSYVMSVDHVNRNSMGYVDFEKMQGIEGVAIINRVMNPEEVDDGAEKKLKTFVTHNDGAAWDAIARPADPKNGEKFECSKNDNTCTLNLHGYSERDDYRDSYSSPSAVGLMIAKGNVGEYLGSKKEADTFITRDGGLTWQLAMRGSYMWEYGDQGSILVIVKEKEPTTSIFYSLNEGDDWIEYTFYESSVLINDITTVPSDTSLQFLLWGELAGQPVTINIDFSDMKERSEACQFDGDDAGSPESDYKLWSPKHPHLDDDCLFGHVAQYHRKKTDRDCYNGQRIDHLHSIARNCSCTREDFECDYNYESDANGQCTLVEGLKKSDPKEVCSKNPDLVEYNLITGYRRIPLSTCQGGKDLEYTSKKSPCPDHEEEYQRRHGISGVGLFFAIVLPISAAAAVGYWAWRNWDGKFGRIQLGDNFGTSSRFGNAAGLFDRDAPWVRYPVIALSAVIAVAASIPMLLRSLASRVFARRSGVSSTGFRSRFDPASTRPFTTRSSFQRGRGQYTVVEPDDGELLGDESEEEN